MAQARTIAAEGKCTRLERETAASAMCALAPSPTVLVAARVAQGALGALMIQQGFGVLSAVFDERERGRAFATFGPVTALAGVGGPILAGG